MTTDTGRIKAFEVLSGSSAYWLGQQTNDSLQRVYGCSFPDKKLMKEHLTRLEEAKKVRLISTPARGVCVCVYTLSRGGCIGSSFCWFVIDSASPFLLSSLFLL